MSTSEKVVLVTGATGRQGGAVVRHMFPKGWRLRALTRNSESYGAKDWRGRETNLYKEI